MSRDSLRLLTGVAAMGITAALVVGAVVLFRGGATATAPVTVLSSRVGLIMNPDAKVKLHGAQVGKVAAIEDLPDGSAAIHLAMNPGYLQLIPANTGVQIVSSTVFGAKYVDLVPPAEPSAQSLHAGQVLDASHVTVEINTVFEHLVDVLSQVQPEKLNEALGAMAQALGGRGEKLGQTLVDFDAMLTKIDPSLPAMSQEIATAPKVLSAYADAGPDLMDAARNASRLSDTIVERQQDLDTVLLSAAKARFLTSVNHCCTLPGSCDRNSVIRATTSDAFCRASETSPVSNAEARAFTSENQA